MLALVFLDYSPSVVHVQCYVSNVIPFSFHTEILPLFLFVTPKPIESIDIKLHTTDHLNTDKYTNVRCYESLLVAIRYQYIPVILFILVFQDVDPDAIQSSLTVDGLLVIKAAKKAIESPKERVIPVQLESAEGGEEQEGATGGEDVESLPEEEAKQEAEPESKPEERAKTPAE